MPILVQQPTGSGYQGIPGETPGIPLAHVTATLGGVALGTVDDFGARLFLTRVDGWWAGTGTSGEVTQRAADHGGWSNQPFRAPRHIELDIEIDAHDYDAATAAIERVIDAIPLQADTLMVASGQEALQATVQQDGDIALSRAEQENKRPGRAKLTIALVAPDPRRYAIEETTAVAALPQTVGGLMLPFSLPISIGATTVSGVLTTTNDGNIDTPPTFTVAGPCPPFVLAHRTSGAVLRFSEAIAAGRTLVIDTSRRLAMLDGTATRTVTGTWFSYSPGVNEVAFSAESYDAGALLTSTHRSAWK